MKKMTPYLIALFAIQSFMYHGFAQTTLWAGIYGGDGEDVVVNIHADAEGNLYSTGYFSNFCDFDISDATTIVEHGNDFEIFVSKYNSNGELQWVKTLGGANGENGTAITTDTAGNVYVTGVFQDQMDFDPGAGEFLMTPVGYLDTFVLKLDPNGNFIWAKSIGGIDYEQANGIGVDDLGNVYLSGFFFSTTDFDPGAAEYNLTPYGFHDGFALKLNSDGDFVWAKQFGGIDFDFVTALKVTNTGNLHIVGSFSGQGDFNPDPNAEFLLSTPQNNDGCFLLNLDTNGNFINAIKVGQSTFRIFGLGVALDTQGAIVISGYYGGDISFALANNSTVTYASPNFFNGFVVKVNPSGQVTWAKNIDADLGSEGFGVVTNSLNEILVSGFFVGTLTSGSMSLTKANTTAAQESFLLKFDSNGNTVAAYQFGGANYIDGFPVAIDQNNNVYLSTAFQNTIDLNPMPDITQEVTSVNLRDNFIIKMDNTTLANPNFETNTFTVFPNPTQEQITITANNSLMGMAYNLTDITGRIVDSGNISESQNISVAKLPAGTYVLKVGQTCQKIVKF